MVLLIDHRDSFVHNLARYFRELGRRTDVRRADTLDIDAALRMRPTHIVLSPGPGTPADAGLARELALRAGAIPVLGVCLGHQCIAAAFGATVEQAARPRHGRAVWVEHTGAGPFRGLPHRFLAGLYHSLAVAERGLPPCLEVVARSLDGEIMGIRHAALPVWGVQFHPESVLTEHGHALLRNFLELETPADRGAPAPAGAGGSTRPSAENGARRGACVGGSTRMGAENEVRRGAAGGP